MVGMLMDAEVAAIYGAEKRRDQKRERTCATIIGGGSAASWTGT